MNQSRAYCFPACLLIASIALAQPPEKAVGVRDSTPEKPARVYARLHALCIGINDYASAGIPDLSYAEADARDVADVLTTVYGFDDVRVLLGKNATQKNINGAIADLYNPDHIGVSDAVVIYFSGHGATVKQGSAEGGYLIPQDAMIALKDMRNPAPYRRDALPMDDLRRDAESVPARHVLFLVDACYSGYLAARSVEAPPDLVAALKYPARQVITAGTAGEESLEHNAWGHGAFTFKLLEILRAEDRPLQASRLGVMLKERVPREVAAKFGDKRSLSPQAKYLSGEGDFLFIRPGALLSTESDRPRPPVEPPAADPLALLKQGDRRTIEKLVSDGDFQTAMDKLSKYESDYEADDFARRLRPILAARLVPVRSQPVRREPPQLLFAVRDDPDPIEVGTNTTYTITVTNQGSTVGKNIIVECTLPDEEEFVSAGGTTAASNSGKIITFAAVPSLNPRTRASWTVTVKVKTQGDVRFKTTMRSDFMTGPPVEETESTRIYEGRTPVTALGMNIVDNPDPVEIGTNTTYTITVQNNGIADGTNVTVECELPPELEFVDAGGRTRGTLDRDRMVRFVTLRLIRPNEQVQWSITAKAMRAGDVRFRGVMNYDQARSPEIDTVQTTIHE